MDKAILGTIAILIVSTAAFAVLAQESGDVYYYDALNVLNCHLEFNEKQSEGYNAEHCNAVVGKKVFYLSAKEGKEGEMQRIPFPPNSGGYSRDQINCENPEYIAVAKYAPGSENGWQILDTTQPPDSERMKLGMYQVSGLIDSSGYYAVILENEVYRRPERGENYCTPLDCGAYKMHLTTPYDANVKAGSPINFRFCSVSKHCAPYTYNDDGSIKDECDERCTQGLDTHCPPVCTNGAGDCCVPDLDGVPDPDCWTKPDDNGNIIEADDPDGMKAESEELYDDAEEPTLVSWQEQGSELAISEGRTEHGSTNWKQFEWAFDEPRLLNGEIRFQVTTKDTKGIWFTDFAYTDLSGVEHKLFPLHPYPNDVAFDAGKPISIGTRYYESIPYSPVITPFSIFAWNPYVWYQTENDVNGGDKVQFELPPTGARKISFWAASEKNGEETKFKVSTGMLKGKNGQWNADPDGDNYSNYDDCNDMNPKVHPGAEERCNNYDDNCNGYRQYMKDNTQYGTATYVQGQDTVVYNEASEEGIRIYNEEWTRDNWQNGHYLMPYDGYLQFSRINDQTYAEIWEKDECSKYQQDRQNKEAHPYVYKLPSCDGSGANGPWNAYQPVITYGDDGRNWQCIPGAHASCRIGALPAEQQQEGDYVGEDERFNYYNRYSIRAKDEKGDIAECTDNYANDEEPVDAECRDIINQPKNRIELKEGEMIWSSNWEGCGLWGTDCDSGELAFDIYRYPKAIAKTDSEGRLRVNGQLINDEGIDGNPLDCSLEKQDKMAVYVCSGAISRFEESLMSAGKSPCLDGELCSYTNEQGRDNCTLQTTESQLGTQKQYTAFVCREGEKCYPLFHGLFSVCTETETNCKDGVDNDCDGLTDRGNQETGEPGDSDCQGECDPGDCKLETKEWCEPTTIKWTKPANYCERNTCGKKDPSCMSNCAEGEASCNGGCRKDTCDYSAETIGQWCTDKGTWTEAGYCAKCGAKDFDCKQVSCEPGACDIANNRTCHMGGWATSVQGKSYCATECGKTDSECNMPCTEGACDTKANKACKNNAWAEPLDYCAECGAVDADCGTTGCEEGICLISGSKPIICKGNEWAQQTRDDFCKIQECRDNFMEFCESVCPEQISASETICNDKIDNDCNGKTDCNDDTCKELPECAEPPCNSGEERDCMAPNAEKCKENCWCKPGKQTCGTESKWGSCIGAVGLETEICNAWDDNCDGSVDEGCECVTGEIKSCGTDTGVCFSGIQECKDGKWGRCYRANYGNAANELCNGLDDDCDGQIDEGCPCTSGATQTCGENKGICKQGTQACTSGAWGACTGGIQKIKEMCNDKLDNDCDGLTDMDDDSCKTTSISPTCYEGIMNQGEENTDCGGPCESCSRTSCNDRKKNGDEENTDCGGSCSIQCTGVTKTTTADKDITEEQVAECGNGECEDGEDADLCPEDCITESTSSLSAIIIIITVLATLGGLFLGYKKGWIKMKGAAKPAQSYKPGQISQPSPGKPAPAMPQVKQFQPLHTKEFKSREEMELEKSLKAHEDILKK